MKWLSDCIWETCDAVYRTSICYSSIFHNVHGAHRTHYILSVSMDIDSRRKKTNSRAQNEISSFVDRRKNDTTIRRKETKSKREICYGRKYIDYGGKRQTYSLIRYVGVECIWNAPVTGIGFLSNINPSYRFGYSYQSAVADKFKRYTNKLSMRIWFV